MRARMLLRLTMTHYWWCGRDIDSRGTATPVRWFDLLLVLLLVVVLLLLLLLLRRRRLMLLLLR